MYLGDAYGAGYGGGLRFRKVQIAGTVTRAYVSLYAQETGNSASLSLQVRGVLAPNPAAPLSYAEVMALPRTTASVTWPVEARPGRSLVYDAGPQPHPARASRRLRL